MNIGDAIQALKEGQRVTREAWASGTWIILVPGSTVTVQADRPLGIAAPHLVGDTAQYEPHVDMCIMRGGHVHMSPKIWGTPDFLAEDWEIYPASRKVANLAADEADGRPHTFETTKPIDQYGRALQ